MEKRQVRSGEPKFAARPDTRSGWCVYVEWPSGATDTLTGFEKQYDALVWIEKQSANWVVDKLLAEDES